METSRVQNEGEGADEAMTTDEGGAPRNMEKLNGGNQLSCRHKHRNRVTCKVVGEENYYVHLCCESGSSGSAMKWPPESVSVILILNFKLMKSKTSNDLLS
jgi:hypothetical protein